MGRVRRADQRTILRAVVTKVRAYFPGEYRGECDRSRLELDLIQRLHHLSLLPVFERGEVGGIPDVTMTLRTRGSIREGDRALTSGGHTPRARLTGMRRPSTSTKPTALLV
jgi:hypothetical protein